MMYRPILFVVALFAVFQGYESQQIQMPESAALFKPDEDIMAEVQSLQRNISELWTYIHQLRGAVTQHLNHLREHQVELEKTVHKIEHHNTGSDTHAAHTDDHHHSGENHHHSGEQHSHGSDQHHHSGEQHSHGGDQHHHSGESHSHSGEHHSHGPSENYHSSHSHDSHSHDSHSHDSHSHTGDDHGSHSSHEEGDHQHHHDHKDSHEKDDDLQQSQRGADDLQQSQRGADPISEPLVVPTQTQSHNSHHHHGSHSSISQPLSSSFKPLPLAHHHHHHGHHQPSTNRSRVVILPKYSEYDLYEFAVCNVMANRAIPDDQQQDIGGQILLWQKKRGGPLNIHVRVQGFRMGDHHAHHQTQQQDEDNETPSPVSHKHGFHVHTSGDLSNGCQSTGPHYNPKSVTHGGPNALVRHVGDLGNIECDEHGVTNIVFSDEVASLTGQYSIVGKSMVIHSGADDYGLGENEESSKTGNAGTRIACCLIEKVAKLPIRAYKAIKTAKQHQN